MNTLIRKEIFVSLIINLLIGTAMTVLTLPKVDTLLLIGGPESGGFGLIASGFMISLLSSPIITLLLQNKLRNGTTAIPQWQADKASRLLPSNLILRTLVFAVMIGFVLAPLVLLLSQTLFGTSWTYQQAFILNILFLIIIAVVLVPFVVRSAVYNYQ